MKRKKISNILFWITVVALPAYVFISIFFILPVIAKIGVLGCILLAALFYHPSKGVSGEKKLVVIQQPKTDYPTRERERIENILGDVDVDLGKDKS